MTSFARPHVAAATPASFALAGPIAVGAGLAALAGLWFLTNLLSSMPQAGAVETRLTPQVMAMPSVGAGSVSRADTSVPGASTVFVGSATSVDESTPTF